MKTITLIIALVATVANSAWATEPNKKNTLKTEVHSEILTPALDTLFLNERLNEAIVKPVYTTTEQLIFSEQVKLLKQEKQANGKG